MLVDNSSPSKKQQSSRRVVVSAKIKPALRRRLEQMAADAGDDHLGTFCARILEDFARGLVPCPQCKHSHPFHQEVPSVQSSANAR
jgi:hypothetical protein